MSRLVVTKTAFTAGELDPHLLGRLDLKVQEEGATRLRNVVVEPTGGVSRRPGLSYVAPAPNARRLVSFDRQGGAELFAFAPNSVRVFRDGIERDEFAAPFGATHLDGISVARWGDRLLVVHPEVEPQEIVRLDAATWTARAWRYETGTDGSANAPLLAPFAKHARPEAVIEIGGPNVDGDGNLVSGSAVELLCTEPFFDPLHLGVRLLIEGVQVRLENINANRLGARGTILGSLPDGLRTREWQEEAFGRLRGWPASVAVYQDRLAIGGSRDAPDHLWLSRTGRPFNFDLGQGLADEAISFRLGGDRVHEIRSLLAGRHLQVFTSAGEWTVRGQPLTPETVETELQTRIGSWRTRRLQPVNVDGATLFVGASGRDLREYLFADTEQAYQAADIALLSRHLMADAQDLAFDPARRLLMIVRGDGRLATVTIDRNSNVAAWALQEAAVPLRAAAVHDGVTHLLVETGAGIAIATLDDAAQQDLPQTRESAAPTRVWTGLQRYEGREVRARGDNGVESRAVVTAGAIVLPATSRSLSLGLPIAAEVQPMPLAAAGQRGAVLDRPYRPVKVTFRLLETAALRVDVGDGVRPALVTGGGRRTIDLAVAATGWRRGIEAMPWRVVQDDAAPLTLLSVTTEIKVND